MAAVAPQAQGVIGWVHPSDARAVVDASGTSKRVKNGRPGVSTYFFLAVSDADTYTVSSWRGPAPKLVHWIPSTNTGTDSCTPSFALSGGDLVITFQTDAGASTGYLEIHRAGS